MALSPFVAVLLTFAATYLLKKFLDVRRRKGIPLPPGPRGLPLLGNMLDMPKERWARTFVEWGKRYGDIFALDLPGQYMVVVNDAQIILNMLDKKSSIYSDRARAVFGGELVGWENSMILQPYSDRFREYRKFMAQFMGSRAQVARFHPISIAAMRKFVRNIYDDPEHLSEYIRQTAGRIILKLAYGYDVKDGRDYFVDHVEKTMDEFSYANHPGIAMDLLPFLRHFPTWFPGNSIKQNAQSWRADLDETVQVPFDMARKRIGEHSETPNYTADLLSRSPEKEFNIKWSALSMYAGGADTTVSANYSFFLAMVLYPEVQRKAQKEIDDVVGTDRFPSFDDREKLPYCEALVKEVLRWNPVAPLGMPHKLEQDDVQAGYFIPKGSIIMPNIWKYLHDPESYVDPFVFNPERFLGNAARKPEQDPKLYAFGFGRRICPGIHLADSSVWLSAVMCLAVFNITKDVENGKVIEPEVEYTDGLISHPKPFKCSIKARSAEAEALIMEEDSK